MEYRPTPTGRKINRCFIIHFGLQNNPSTTFLHVFLKSVLILLLSFVGTSSPISILVLSFKLNAWYCYKCPTNDSLSHFSPSSYATISKREYETLFCHVLFASPKKPSIFYMLPLVASLEEKNAGEKSLTLLSQCLPQSYKQYHIRNWRLSLEWVIGDMFQEKMNRMTFQIYMKTTTPSLLCQCHLHVIDCAFCQFSTMSMHSTKWCRCTSSPGLILRALTWFGLREEQSTRSAKSMSLFYRFPNLRTIPFFFPIYI